MPQITDLQDYMVLSATINYQLTATPVNWQAVLSLARDDPYPQPDDEALTCILLLTPTQACALSVPYWTAYMEEHSNQGWVRLEDPGRHTLSVFGEAPGKGAPVHCLVETVPVEDDLPFHDAALACFLGDDTCTCSEVCGCDEIHSR